MYRPLSKQNEWRSAQWVAQFLAGQYQCEARIQRVHRLIMATCHHSNAIAGDLAWMVDIDLSILGSAADIFWQYEQDIRREYRQVPGPLFRYKRRQLLQQLLARERIYQTDYFYQRYEQSARNNIAYACAA